MSPILFSLLLLAAERPDLEGRVVARGGGPISGAHVLISTAAPRQGTSPLCPSCYLDCRKKAETDAEGRFRIASLDPELVFGVLVVAEGYRPEFARKADPTGGPVEVSLTALDPNAIDPRLVLRGVVVDPQGRPVVGASVSARGVHSGSSTRFGSDVFDPLAVTNLKGEFLLPAHSPFESADLKVEGNGVATRIAPALKAEYNPHTIRMSAGATLTGRVVLDGKPSTGVTVGLVQTYRNAQSFLGDRTIGVDAEGRFTFLNVSPDDEYVVYGLMGTLPDGGAVAARKLSVADGDAVDVGDLAVTRGHRIKGRVILSDGKNVPPKTRLLLIREQAWDTMQVELGPDGGFEVGGIPAERFTVNVYARGYRISPKNHSANANRNQLEGMIDRDVDPLKILLEPVPAK